MSANDFSEGDLIEATKGETVVRGRLDVLPGGWLGTSRRRLTSLIVDGFTPTLIEKATPPLPTADGTVIAGQINHTVGRMPTGWRHKILLHADEWRTPEGYRVDPFAIAYWEVVAEPPAETAKKVLDRVLEEYNNEPPRRFVSDVLPLVGKEFGVDQ